MLKGIVLLVLAAAPLTLASDSYTKTVSQSLDLVPGRSSGISIRLHDAFNHPDFVGKVKPDFEVKGSAAFLRLEAAHHGSVDIELRVRSRTDLQMRGFDGPGKCRVHARSFAGNVHLGEAQSAKVEAPDKREK